MARGCFGALRLAAACPMFHKNNMGSIIRSSGTVFYSLLYLNSRLGFHGLKILYSVISMKIDSLPANTKNRESTRSWTARVRFIHPWAGGVCKLLHSGKLPDFQNEGNTRHIKLEQRRAISSRTSSFKTKLKLISLYMNKSQCKKHLSFPTLPTHFLAPPLSPHTSRAFLSQHLAFFCILQHPTPNTKHHVSFFLILLDNI